MSKPIQYAIDVGRKFARSSTVNKKHIIFVVATSALFRFTQLFLPFRWLAPQLGTHHNNLELCAIASPQQTHRAWKTARFIENVCNKTPWQAKCLVQALILRRYLKKYQIPHIIHIGLAKDNENPDRALLAHAWVNVGRFTVLGGGKKYDTPTGFVVMGTYVSETIADSIANEPS